MTIIIIRSIHLKEVSVYKHPRKGSCEEYHSSQRTLHTTSQKSYTSKRSSNYRCHPHSRDHYGSRDSFSENEDYYNRTSSRTTDRNDSRSRTGSHKQRTPQHPDRSSRYDDRQWSQYSPASLRQSYRHTKRRTRTPSLSPSRHPSRNYQSLRNHSSNGHSRSSTGRRLEKIQVMKISCLKLKTEITEILRPQESLELLMILQLPVFLVLSRSSFTDLIILTVWPSLDYQEVRRLLELDFATSL